MPKVKRKYLHQREHAKQRMAERFGVVINNESLREAARKIQNQEATFVRKQSNRVTIWNVVIADSLVKVAYDKNTHQIITVMFP